MSGKNDLIKYGILGVLLLGGAYIASRLLKAPVDAAVAGIEQVVSDAQAFWGSYWDGAASWFGAPPGHQPPTLGEWTDTLGSALARGDTLEGDLAVLVPGYQAGDIGRCWTLANEIFSCGRPGVANRICFDNLWLANSDLFVRCGIPPIDGGSGSEMHDKRQAAYDRAVVLRRDLPDLASYYPFVDYITLTPEGFLPSNQTWALSEIAAVGLPVGYTPASWCVEYPESPFCGEFGY
ncbi:hypothetical protein ES708_20232 [subsurface metagenome]